MIFGFLHENHKTSKYSIIEINWRKKCVCGERWANISLISFLFIYSKKVEREWGPGVDSNLNKNYCREFFSKKKITETLVNVWKDSMREWFLYGPIIIINTYSSSHTFTVRLVFPGVGLKLIISRKQLKLVWLSFVKSK